MVSFHFIIYEQQKEVLYPYPIKTRLFGVTLKIIHKNNIALAAINTKMYVENIKIKIQKKKREKSNPNISKN